MKNKIRNFLELSSAERKGIVVLVMFIALLTVVHAYLAFHKSGITSDERRMLETETQNFEKQFSKDSSGQRMDWQYDTPVEPSDHELFQFDPNKVDAVALKSLGFNKRQIRNILLYRAKGGVFHKKEDLKKIYGMDDSLYLQLAPYIEIRKTLRPYIQPKLYKQPKIEEQHFHHELTDINQVDTSALMSLNGIGPVLSKRIIRYRSLLGGFYSLEQLKEVYGLTDTLVSEIAHRFIIDTNRIARININTATEIELIRHPYIGKYTAHGIISYRKKVVEIKKAEELKINGLLSEERFQKLKRYLTN